MLIGPFLPFPSLPSSLFCLVGCCCMALYYCRCCSASFLSCHVLSGFVLWYANFFSILVVAGLAMHALWPMVSLSLGWSIPSFYYIKVSHAMLIYRCSDAEHGVFGVTAVVAAKIPRRGTGNMAWLGCALMLQFD